jgi:hypothetical protein
MDAATRLPTSGLCRLTAKVKGSLRDTLAPHPVIVTPIQLLFVSTSLNTRRGKLGYELIN